jgi:hypothetical protein
VYLHVRDRVSGAYGWGVAQSKPATKGFGVWEKLTCVTQFQSQAMRVHVQVGGRVRGGLHVGVGLVSALVGVCVG